MKLDAIDACTIKAMKCNVNRTKLAEVVGLSAPLAINVNQTG